MHPAMDHIGTIVPYSDQWSIIYLVYMVISDDANFVPNNTSNAIY